MKVDFIVGSFGKGGAERVMATLASYFVKMGHEVRLITFDNNEDQYDLPVTIVRVRLVKNFSSNAKINRLLGLIRFYKHKKRRPNVVISFLTFTNLVTILACKFRKIPVIVSEHNNHTHTPKPAWLLKITWNYVYRMADNITVLTDFDVDFFENKKAKVVVMPNPSSFKSLISNKHPRENTILAVGSLNRIYHKGFDNLIEIMAQILPNHPKWKLKIVGGGKPENLKKLISLAKEKKIENQIEFAGYCNNVQELMKKASVFILSSRYEGLPMVLLEAMSQGMACISYNCTTGPSNMITNDVNGILIKDQDKEEMVTQLESLLLNQNKRQEIGTAALFSLEQYAIHNIYKKWEILLPKF